MLSAKHSRVIATCIFGITAGIAHKATATQYTLTAFDEDVYLTSINDSGQIAGFFYDDQAVSGRAFLYDNGNFTDLGTQGGDSRTRDINNAGHVVITSDHPSVWNGTSFVHVPAPPNTTNPSIRAIADSDSIGMTARPTSNSVRSYVYANGVHTVVGPTYPTPHNTIMNAMNDAGWVTGVVSDPNPVAWLYKPDTGVQFIPLLSPQAHASAYSINDDGDVVGDGYGWTPARQRGFLYTADGQLHELMPLIYGNLSRYVYVRSINNDQLIVGVTGGSNTGLSTNRGVLWDGVAGASVPQDLTSMLDETGAGWTLTLPTDVNAKGQIVGQGYYDPDGLGIIQPVMRGFLITNTTGDFDLDGDLDAVDIDQLYAAEQGAIPPAQKKFDVDSDGNVNSIPNTDASDADYWVRQLKSTEYGDIDLDRDVDFSDLLVVAQNYDSDTGGWSQGNVDRAAGVNFGDLLMIAQNYGFGWLDQNTANIDASFAADWSRARSMVPEPATAIGTLSIALMLQSRRRTRTTPASSQHP